MESENYFLYLQTNHGQISIQIFKKMVSNKEQIFYYYTIRNMPPLPPQNPLFDTDEWIVKRDVSLHRCNNIRIISRYYNGGALTSRFTI